MNTLEELSKNFSLFIEATEVTRNETCADVKIVGMIEGKRASVGTHLCGFLVDGDKSDYEIKEEAFSRFQDDIKNILVALKKLSVKKPSLVNKDDIFYN